MSYMELNLYHKLKTVTITGVQIFKRLRRSNYGHGNNKVPHKDPVKLSF